MKKISYWGKSHPYSARLIIIVSQIIIFLLGAVIANSLSRNNINFSIPWTYLFIAIFFAVALIYTKKKWSYAKRKTLDLLIAFIGFCLVVLCVNRLNQPGAYSNSAIAAIKIKEPIYKNPEAEKLLTAFKAGEKTKFSGKEKRIIKREFNYQLKKYIKAKVTGKKSDADQTLLIILACIGAVGLLYIIAGLACSLSCNGSDAAAVVVGVLGVAAVIWLLIITIRAINRKGQKKKTA
jgi:hypothetical protein